jgi:hypothetical protein
MMRPLNNSARASSAFTTLLLCICAVLNLWACSSGDPTEAPTSPGSEKPADDADDADDAAGTSGASSGKDAGGGTGSTRTDAGISGSGGARDAGLAKDGGSTPGTGGTSGTATGGADGGTPDPTTGGVADGGTPGTTSGSRPLSSSRKLPTMMETPGVAPFFHVWRPTDLSAVEGRLPVVVWNNGACNRNDKGFQPLFDKWAAGGYFVVSLTSGGGSSMTTIADQKALLEWVVAQDSMAGGPYNGKLDLDRITAGGNSCGGITSLGLASMDKRVAAVFVLSGSTAMGSPNKTVINGIKVPVAYVIGGTEDIARANAEADYAAFADGLPAMLVKRSSGDHLTISNDAKVMVDAADISVNWLDLTMYGLQGALDALKTPTVCAGCMSGLWTVTAKNLETLV